jgi:homoserine kinase
MFQLCADLEGHPDNAAPASFGGFTVVGAARRAGRMIQAGLALQRAVPTIQRFEVSGRLYFILLIPDFEIKTSLARRILPSKISRLAAVKNSANACAIAAAFVSKDYHKLRGAFADYLHQPFRAKLIPFLPFVIAAAERAGALGAFLSGSGSTICAVTLQDPDRVAAAMKRAARSSVSHTIVTRADNRGARIMHLRN